MSSQWIFHKRLVRLLSSVMVLLAAVCLASPANAEGNCPAGMYPIGGGEVGWAGCAPMNPGSGSGGGGQLSVAQRTAPHDSYYAVVSHPRSSDVWIMSNAPNREQIEIATLKVCGMVMGDGCRLELTSLDSIAAIARGMNGDMYYASATTSKQADAAVLDYCRKLNDYCAIFRHWTSSRNHGLQSYNPGQSSPRMFISSAWVRDPSTGKHPEPTFFVSGGHATQEAAERAAVAACQLRTKKSCDVARTASDVFIIMGRQSDGAVWIASSPSEEMAATIAKDACGKIGVSCTITSLIPARSSAIVEHSPLQ